MEDPEVRARRRRVITVAALAVLLFAAVVVKVASMQLATRWGQEAWRSGDHAAAEKWFTVAGRVNLVQRWIAPYDQGVVAHSRGEWLVATVHYEQAMRLAPKSAECRIVLNWTWALESAGDELAESGDGQMAAQRWAEARRVLAQADGCEEGATAPPPPPSPSQQDQDQQDQEPQDRDEEPADSAQSAAEQTDQRLAEKLQIGDQPPQDSPAEQAGEQQADRLADRNEEGARERQRSQDQREGSPDDGNDRTW